MAIVDWWKSIFAPAVLRHSSKTAVCCALLVAVVALAAVYGHPDEISTLASVSPFSAKWAKASSADSKFLETLHPSADEEMDDEFKRRVALGHEPRTSFSHGQTRVSLGPEAVRTVADGSSISWRSPPPPEVEAARNAAGSIGTGFGGGDTMRPRMRVSPRLRKMVPPFSGMQFPFVVVSLHRKCMNTHALPLLLF